MSGISSFIRSRSPGRGLPHTDQFRRDGPQPFGVGRVQGEGRDAAAEHDRLALEHRSLVAVLEIPPGQIAVALCPFFAPGVNTLRAAFLEPEMRAFYRDWEDMTAKSVAYLRSVIGGAVDEPRLVELIGELSLRSERFRTLWARQDVRQKTSGVSRLLHPQVGKLDLNYEKLALPGAPGQMLVTYHAAPGSPSCEKLQLLAHLTTRPSTGRERWV
ncbi:hypothetical protein [Sphaerisporangium sp. NPDC051011]|uniref:MmyB family transcriptional regulator n=1 Tax=Sphaerisporangium sp. NPDC051011 TaxID=3155792 RepID=UPI0033E8AC27